MLYIIYYYRMYICKELQLKESPLVWLCCMKYRMNVFFLLLQCAEEGQASGEDPTFSTPRLLSGSEMKTLLQWEEAESHPLTTLEKQLTVQITSTNNFIVMLPWWLRDSGSSVFCRNCVRRRTHWRPCWRM